MERMGRMDTTAVCTGSRGNSNTNKLWIALLVAVSLVAPGYGQTDNFVYAPTGRRAWVIAHGHDWGAQEYFDPKGFIRGFSIDIIQAVCEAGNLYCLPVWAPNSECWYSEPGEHPSGGRGLLDGWFDACTGWAQTTDRIHVFSFGIPHVAAQTSRFYRKIGSDFDPSDLKGKKIGFVAGWFSDEKCLARAESSTRQNYVLSKEQIIYETSPEVLVPKLIDGTVDAIFSQLDAQAKYYQNIEEIPNNEISCMIDGNAMMTRKDSDFLPEWNRAFRKLKASGGYDKLCQEAAQRHELRGPVRCG